VCSELKRLSTTESEGLVMPFTMLEVKSAVWECGDDKAPGPDGYNFRFFKRFWESFKEDFFRIMVTFHESGSISPGCGSSFITLIPKGSNVENLGDYQPINLIGCISKVVSKVLSNKLQGVISWLSPRNN
jgi:hypothetical protein